MKGKKKDAILRTKRRKEKALSIVRSYDGGSQRQSASGSVIGLAHFLFMMFVPSAAVWGRAAVWQGIQRVRASPFFPRQKFCFRAEGLERNDMNV